MRSFSLASDAALAAASVFHALDFGVGEAAGSFDADALFLACGFVLGALTLSDAVGVYH